MSRYFFVSSADRDEVEPILDDGTGPIETVCDLWEGTATTRAHARRQAWREWEKDCRSCVHINRSDRKHPMSGVSVVELLPCPIHGQRMGDGVALMLAGEEICDCEFEQVGRVIRWKRAYQAEEDEVSYGG